MGSELRIRFDSVAVAAGGVGTGSVAVSVVVTWDRNRELGGTPEDVSERLRMSPA